MAQLQSALNAQDEVNQTTNKANELQKRGSLSQAIASIQRADQREKEKAQALTTAAQQLQALVDNLNQALADTSSPASTGTDNSAGQASGLGQVTVSVTDTTSN
ncbi:MAG: hypothetical protein K6T63_00720 [Alicyclobacillus herbarius]|uniref:hypothetical protein n=1 Tax=Alicyclobacillus herbarius TaxID=122960 RepID=UPI0023565881|nr:hypothetical protein [Alicyclobacillus herbarius]MCL6631127.1 hypothetical protein [Alicyclobacillus herbarius]